MSELPEPLRAAVEHGALVVAGTPESPVKHILAALAAAWPSVLAAEEVRWYTEAKRLRALLVAAVPVMLDALPPEEVTSEAGDYLDAMRDEIETALAVPAPEPPALVELVGGLRTTAAYSAEAKHNTTGSEKARHEVREQVCVEIADELAVVLGMEVSR